MVGRHGEGNLSVGDAWSPSGFFTAASFPMSELQSDGVHFFDIVDHPGDIDFFALSTAYKVACEKKGLQPRNPLASRTNCQKTQWSKWCFWSSLTKRSPFSSTYPSLKRSRCRCWRNWSMEALSSFNSCQQTWKKCSTAWKTWEAALSHASTSDPKGSSKLNVAILNRKTTRRLIRDLIISFAKPNDPHVKWLNWNGRRRSCATRTLPSLVGLVLSSAKLSGASCLKMPLLAKGPMHSPVPSTPVFYDTSVLKVLDKIWDFDQSALILWRKPSWPIGACGTGRTQPSQIQSGWEALLTDARLSSTSLRRARLCINWGFPGRYVPEHPSGRAGKTNLGLLQTTPTTTGWTCRMTSWTTSPLRVSTSWCSQQSRSLHLAPTWMRSSREMLSSSPRSTSTSARPASMQSMSIYGEHKGGNKEMPANLYGEIEEEQRLVSVLMGKMLQGRKVNKGEEKTRQQIRANLLEKGQVRFQVPYRFLGESRSWRKPRFGSWSANSLGNALISMRTVMRIMPHSPLRLSPTKGVQTLTGM